MCLINYASKMLAEFSELAFVSFFILTIHLTFVKPSVIHLAYRSSLFLLLQVSTSISTCTHYTLYFQSCLIIIIMTLF